MRAHHRKSEESDRAKPASVSAASLSTGSLTTTRACKVSAELRRANLLRWLKDHDVAFRGSSDLRQLKPNAAFGDRTARRLERNYGMGMGYLDQPINPALGQLYPSDWDVLPQDLREVTLAVGARYNSESIASAAERESDPIFDVLHGRGSRTGGC
ncbi:hypothetical protein [Burkholderia sp. L27(2015)]|uniref:hypothetical protein n=1 Tax=Burkholderia sp. L27(2015) TaxID=1641858 RepID=UPI00131B3061|nr:hypothetical protein [Burkholderia sp. L27(2015)]